MSRRDRRRYERMAPEKCRDVMRTLVRRHERAAKRQIRNERQP